MSRKQYTYNAVAATWLGKKLPVASLRIFIMTINGSPSNFEQNYINERGDRAKYTKKESSV